MNVPEEVKTFSPIFREKYPASDPDPGTAPEPTVNYVEVVKELELNPEYPTALMAVKKVLEEILIDLGYNDIQLNLKDKELLASDGSVITDFIVILLKNVQQHSLNGTNHSMLILVLSKYMPPVTATVELSRIGSHCWIDDLGPKYYYEKGFMSLIEKQLRMMAKSAPDKHIYEYSGWSTDGGNFYIFDGKPLRSDDRDKNDSAESCMHTLDMLSVASHTLTIPLLAGELISLVHSRLMQQGDYFKGVICITALTQSFKTTLASLFFDLKNGREATTTAIVRSIGNNDVVKLTYYQDNHRQYREFIKAYISYIASKDVDDFCRGLINRFRSERNTLRGKLTDKDMPVDNRTSDMCTWLWLSFSEFLNYALQLEVITQEQFESYSDESQTVFTSIMERQAYRVAELSPIKQFFLGLRVLIETNEVKITELKAQTTDFYAYDSKEVIGFRKKEYIYLKNNVAFQAVVNYWHRNGRNFSMKEAELRKVLADSRYIIPSSEKSYIHRLTVNGTRYQCIKFKEDKYNELCRNNDEAKDDGETPSDRGLRKNADHILR